MSADDEIRLTRRGGLVVVTLNRPRALNALSLPMCRALAAGLASWQADPAVHAVLIKGAGERAFCAGGDIRWLYGILTSEGVAAAVRFYALEYPMNAQLHQFSKPYIALLDGITMGGGVGISVHGSHRVVTERTVFAMPETGIGLFPDVGATYVLPRLPGGLGMYLGLTGARLGAADCLTAGLATHHVPAARLAALEDALAAADLSARRLCRGRPGAGGLRRRSGRGRAARLCGSASTRLWPAAPGGCARGARRRAFRLGAGPARGARPQVADQPRGHLPAAADRPHPRLQSGHAPGIPACPSLHGRA